MTNSAVSFAAALALLLGVHSAYSEAAADVLVKLAEELSTIRAASGPEPVYARPIEIEQLPGLSRDAVLASLGTPDNCGRELTEECGMQSSWSYWFFYLPRGWRGGGPELWLEFNSEGIVDTAQWRFSR